MEAPTQPSQSQPTQSKFAKPSAEASDASALELLPGSTVEAQHKVYIVGKLLNVSDTRGVYTVRDVEDMARQYAMKIERKSKKREDSKIQREVSIMKVLAKHKDATHFPRLVDRGLKENLIFCVVELVGSTFADLRARRSNKAFSISTGIEVGRQALMALSTLHLCGYVHRDIKLSNFAMGLKQSSRTVYMVDFGITRKFLNANGKVMASRSMVGFKGSLKYAPLSGHRLCDIYPKDDCESWFYMLIDLIAPSGLPWQDSKSYDSPKRADMDRMKEDVGKIKEALRTSRDNLYKGLRCARQLDTIFEYIIKQRCEDRIDYAYIVRYLKKAATVSGANLEEKFDWETGTKEGTSKAHVRSNPNTKSGGAATSRTQSPASPKPAVRK